MDVADDDRDDDREREIEIDVQWVAHIIPADGFPTPASGDSRRGAIWVGVPDPNYDDPDPPNIHDGELRRTRRR